MNPRRIFSTALLCTLLWSAHAAPARAQDSVGDFLRSNPKFLRVFREVVAGPSHYVVRVRNDGKDAALGVIVGADGWILTKAFDLKGDITCRLADGRMFDARLVGVHAIHDLALLKIDATGLPVARFKASTKVAAGSWVASVGIGVDPVAIGVVSVPTRDVAVKGLPIAAAELSKIGYLGVGLEPSSAGIRIIQVMPNTPAAKAGLEANDVILSVSGVKVNDPEQFQIELVKRRAGDTITLGIRRGDDELDVEATLRQRPASDNRGEMQNLMGSALSPRRSGYPTILTHDSIVKPADCGGPLVDLDGNVVGINISRAGRTESWAIPTEVIQELLADLKSGKFAPTEEIHQNRDSARPALIPAAQLGPPRARSDDGEPRRQPAPAP
jgi:serine protease Do